MTEGVELDIVGSHANSDTLRLLRQETQGVCSRVAENVQGYANICQKCLRHTTGLVRVSVG